MPSTLAARARGPTPATPSALRDGLRCAPAPPAALDDRGHWGDASHESVHVHERTTRGRAGRRAIARLRRRLQLQADDASLAPRGRGTATLNTGAPVVRRRRRRRRRPPPAPPRRPLEQFAAAPPPRRGRATPRPPPRRRRARRLAAPSWRRRAAAVRAATTLSTTVNAAAARPRRRATRCRSPRRAFVDICRWRPPGRTGACSWRSELPPEIGGRAPGRALERDQEGSVAGGTCGE